MDMETFEDIQDFVKGEERTRQDYSDNSVTMLLYDYLCELYRKLNVKNTMSAVFHKIQAIKTEIESNDYAINYSRGIIEQRKEDLII